MQLHFIKNYIPNPHILIDIEMWYLYLQIWHYTHQQIPSNPLTLTCSLSFLSFSIAAFSVRYLLISFSNSLSLFLNSLCSALTSGFNTSPATLTKIKRRRIQSTKFLFCNARGYQWILLLVVRTGTMYEVKHL